METALKEQIKRRNELIEKVVNAKNADEGGKFLQELHNDISVAISNAITPVTDITALFIISTLKEYAKVLSENYPDVLSMVDELINDTTKAVFNIPIKGDK